MCEICYLPCEFGSSGFFYEFGARFLLVFDDDAKLLNPMQWHGDGESTLREYCRKYFMCVCV